MSSTRRFIDAMVVGPSGLSTRWSTLVPRKINVLVWRIARDRIPTRLNLRDKGIDLDSCLCPVCDLVGESVVHLFSGCTLLSPIWSMIASWWGVALPSEVTIRSLMEWGDNSGLEMENKRHLEAVIMVVFWSLWRFRNALVFGVVKPRKDELFDDIRTMSYFWITNRRRKHYLDWNSWLICPSRAMNDL